MRKRIAVFLIRLSGWFHRGTMQQPRYYPGVDHIQIGVNGEDGALVIVFDVEHDCIAFEIPKSLPGDMYSYVQNNWDSIADDEEEGEWSDE